MIQQNNFFSVRDNVGGRLMITAGDVRKGMIYVTQCPLALLLNTFYDLVSNNQVKSLSLIYILLPIRLPSRA